MKPLARFATRRPVIVLVAWIAAVFGIQAIAGAAGPELRDEFTLPGTDSQAAYDLLDERFPELGGDVDRLAWTVSEGAVTDPAAIALMEDVIADVAASDHVAAVISPYAEAGAGQISADGTVAYARIQYDDTSYNLPLEAVEHVGEITAAADGAQAGEATVTVGQGGPGAMRLNEPEVGIGEMIGLGIAAVILFIAFGSLVAASVPLISAIVALTGTLGTLGLLSHLGPLTTNAPLLAILLGLGIGIDYALFIVNRHRVGLRAGKAVTPSIIEAMATSGRAVVFAGITVFIALAGMFVPQISFLSGLAVAAIVTVIFSVAASATLVPALLQLFGMKVLSRRQRAQVAAQTADAQATSEAKRQAGGWVSRLVERRPLIVGLAGLAFLLTLAIPALDLRLGAADQGNDPAGTSTRVAYDLIAEGFGPGANGPLLVTTDLTGALDGAPLDPAAPPAGLAELTQTLTADPGVAAVIGPLPNAAGDAAVLQVVPLTSPQDPATEDLVNRVRDDYAPAAQSADVEVHVGGTVASNLDFTQAIADSLPVFFLVVVGVSMLVLVVAFRSLVLPLVGALLNLVAAAAAFGVVVAVFQWGWLSEIVGIGEGGPIEPFAPVILFALLFGLSMDYQVFLVSRISELWHRTHDNATAVRRGQAEVSRVIIAAASIMVVVFGSFVTSDARVMKLLGLGLAAAVFLDAFVIRVLLMPAIMHLLGRWNWWMPAWLDRIVPHVDIDGEQDVEESETSGAQASSKKDDKDERELVDAR